MPQTFGKGWFLSSHQWKSASNFCKGSVPWFNGLTVDVHNHKDWQIECCLGAGFRFPNKHYIFHFTPYADHKASWHPCISCICYPGLAKSQICCKALAVWPEAKKSSTISTRSEGPKNSAETLKLPDGAWTRQRSRITDFCGAPVAMCAESVLKIHTRLVRRNMACALKIFWPFMVSGTPVPGTCAMHREKIPPVLYYLYSLPNKGQYAKNLNSRRTWGPNGCSCVDKSVEKPKNKHPISLKIVVFQSAIIH